MSNLKYLNAYSEAKNEYTEQLQLLITPRLYEGIESIYIDSMKAKNEGGGDNMRIFQNFLKTIPKWNQEIINDETQRIVEDSKCNYLDKLLNAIFISHTKLLTLRKNKKKNNLEINVPKLGYFIHKCYIESARELYKNPYLLDKSIKNARERQTNLRETLNIINKSIKTTIRNLLPMENILNIYLEETVDDTDDEEEFTSSVSKEDLNSVTKSLLQEPQTQSLDLQNGGEPLISSPLIENSGNVEESVVQQELIEQAVDDEQVVETSNVVDEEVVETSDEGEEQQVVETSNVVDEEVVETSDEVEEQQVVETSDGVNEEEQLQSGGVENENIQEIVEIQSVDDENDSETEEQEEKKDIVIELSDSEQKRLNHYGGNLEGEDEDDEDEEEDNLEDESESESEGKQEVVDEEDEIFALKEKLRLLEEKKNQKMEVKKEEKPKLKSILKVSKRVSINPESPKEIIPIDGLMNTNKVKKESYSFY